MLCTERLELVPVTTPLLLAEETGPATLGMSLGATVSPEWPPLDWEPHVRATIALQCAEQPGTVGWHRYVLFPAHDGVRHLVGCLGAFPKRAGEVEIGYSTLPYFQHRGYASEAARALTEWLLGQHGVRCVAAQTFLTKPESVKVMQRCGMLPAGEGDEPGTVRYRRERA